MKTIGLVLVLVVVLASASFAATVDVYSGFNCIAVPNVPTDPTVSSVLSGAVLDGYLTRFEPTGGSDITYYASAAGDFGGMTLGDGYWLYTDNDIAFEYNGLASGVPSAGVKTDMWISLPGNQYDEADEGGWHLIGNPYAEEVNKSNIYFTDGTELLDWTTANLRAWVGDTLQGFDGMYQSNYNVSLGAGDGDVLLPARGYYIETHRDNIAMIIKAP